MTILEWKSEVFNSTREVKKFLNVLSQEQVLLSKIDDYTVYYPIIPLFKENPNE